MSTNYNIMEETKKCPYCREEIKIDAKKCKHCNEWLEGMPNSSTCKDGVECGILPKEPNYPLLAVACWVTMFFAILSSIQDLEMTSGRGRYGILVGIANIIPVWIVTLCDGLLFIYLIMGLRQHCSRIRNSIQIPFNKFIYSYAIVVFATVVDEIYGFSDSESEYVSAILWIIVLCICYWMYMNFIVGVRLRNVLSTHKSVGLWFILWPIILILFTSVLGMSSLSDGDKWGILGGNLAYICLLYCLKNFFRANIDENW